jgi:hypothetical protein
MEKATTGRQTAEHKPASSPRPCENSRAHDEWQCEYDAAVNRTLCLPVQRLTPSQSPRCEDCEGIALGTRRSSCPHSPSQPRH